MYVCVCVNIIVYALYRQGDPCVSTPPQRYTRILPSGLPSRPVRCFLAAAPKYTRVYTGTIVFFLTFFLHYQYNILCTRALPRVAVGRYCTPLFFFLCLREPGYSDQVRSQEGGVHGIRILLERLNFSSKSRIVFYCSTTF